MGGSRRRRTIGPGAAARLQRLNRTLGSRVRQRTRWLTLLHAVTTAVGEASGFDDAVRTTLGLVCRAEHWQLGQMYLPDPSAPGRLVLSIAHVANERLRPFHEASPRTRSLPGERVERQGSTGEKLIWANGAEAVQRTFPERSAAAAEAHLKAALSLPIIAGSQLLGVVELFSNRSHPPSEELKRLMNDVGAQLRRAIQREHATARMAELAWRGQQEVVQVLHDTLGQELAGLGMLSSSLAQTLHESDPAAAATARQITDGARRTLGIVRQLARGMFPVDVDAEGLAVALGRLARTSQEVHRVACQFEHDAPLLIRDNRLATQLYRIAQEAVTNALRHASASRIVIDARARQGMLMLTVADDGVGIGDSASSAEGAGLRIMRYRATTIGGELRIEPGPDGGTVVTCVVREPSEPARAQEGG